MNKHKTVEVLRPIDTGVLSDEEEEGFKKRTGVLLKKSETLKRWNKRVFVFERNRSGNAVLRWSENKIGAALMQLTSKSGNQLVVDQHSNISWYESGDRRKLEIGNHVHTIYIDSAHVDNSVAFDDLSSWYLTLGEYIRNCQFNSVENSEALDEDAIQAMTQAAELWKERKNRLLRSTGRKRRETILSSHSSSSSSSLLQNQQSLDMIARHRDASVPILQNVIDILEWSSYSRFKLQDFQGAKDRRYKAALCHFACGRLKEAIQTSKECLLLLPSSSVRQTRRKSVKICEDFEDLERCMDPIHVLDLLSIEKRTGEILKKEKEDKEEEEEEEEEEEADIRDLTDRKLESEGFSALSFLNVVDIVRDKKSPEPSLYRHRDAPSSFQKYEEAKTASTKLHYISDLIPMLPRDFSDDVSMSLAHTKLPDSIKTAIQLVSDLARSFNHLVLEGAGDTLRTGFGESTFTRLLDMLKSVERGVRALGLPVWPVYAQKGLGWVAIGRLLHCTIVNRDVLKVLQFLARYKKAREYDWWRLVRISESYVNGLYPRIRMSLSYLLSSQRNAISSIIKSCVTELETLIELAKRAQRSIRTALELAGIEMLHIVAVPEELSCLIEARRQALQDYTVRLQKMSLLCKDIINVVYVNLRLWRESKDAVANIPRVSSLNSDDNKTLSSSRTKMVGSYALERIAIPSLHIPAHQLKTFHEHWRSLFSRKHLGKSGVESAVPQRVVDDLHGETFLRGRAVLERAKHMIRMQSDPSNITYMKLKRTLEDEFGADIVKSVKKQISNMILNAYQKGDDNDDDSSKNSTKEEEDEESESRDIVAFSQYLLLFPYKSSSDIQLLMQTKPVQSATLQKSRLLFGVSRSVIQYWERNEQREPFKVQIQKNVIRWKASGSERTFGQGHRHNKGELVDTKEMSTFQSGEGVGMIVFRSGVCVIHSHLRDRFHHSSIFAGASVNFAGEIKISKGKIKWISNKSGHYQPGLDCVKIILQWLRDSPRGVLLSEFPFDLVHSTEVSPEIMNFISSNKGSTHLLKRYNSNSQSKFLRVEPASLLLAALEKFGV